MIRPFLVSLQPLRSRGHEIVLVDGGSWDATRELARPLVDLLLSSPSGRARQMNAGAMASGGGVFWFLHADTALFPGAEELLLEVLARPAGCWGRFNVTLSGRHPLLRMVAFMMNLRSRMTGIATGDQGIFVRRHAFFAVGGFPDIPLMEDIVLCRRLKRLASPHCLPGRLCASSRRWERDGILRTILLMWRLRLAFAFGADPVKLAQRYGQCSTPTPES